MTYTNTDKLPINQCKIKSLPPQLRPDEKLEQYGATSLTDGELLAVVIRTGFKGNNSVMVAENILKCGGLDGLLGLCQVDLKDLQKVRGVGFVKAVQIKAIAELARRISKRTARKRLIINSPDTVADYLMEDMRHLDKESFVMLCLDGKGALVGESIVSIGTVNASLASPREVYLEALRHKAVSIILVHNHPSGNPTPSQNDIIVTEKMKEAGEILGITLIDHIIIGDNSYVSLNEERLM